eukprot:CAMPEP_0171058528 /NCGR_PEP_ID=MMETSP0766_2-20121228/2547_1 /TAXON_ID=439317 /ORGANISM="Gambierdiscus australes, Strain CAWD 149" /LENGTH=59 /DNA_ID=CAMNT_0011513813 /DNA_START=56 /DNA_END=235 /DNA_ORIENTATION=-
MGPAIAAHLDAPFRAPLMTGGGRALGRSPPLSAQLEQRGQEEAGCKRTRTPPCQERSMA